MNTDLERHPLSTLWGDIPETEQEWLYQSIKAHGVKNPTITLFESKVLDGWHRYQVVRRLVNEFAYVNVDEVLTFQTIEDETEARAFVVCQNAMRRHLSASQRASAVAAVYSDTPTVPVAEMARQADVSRRTMDDAIRAERIGKGPDVRAGYGAAQRSH